jgi:4-amino-4-deoxy-L-arabinose transferase-like glycosyltransferase
MALGLRLWGFLQGYPEFYGHVDEIGVAASTWNFFRSATLKPTEFTYPACYSYLVAALLWLTQGFWPGPGLGSALEELVLVSYLDPARAALLGRGLSAGLSALSVLLTFFLGKEVWGTRTGLLAALFLALAVVPVGQAHHALPDSAMAFWAVLCFYFSWKVQATGRSWAYILAGAAGGWVVATKYNGAFACLALPAAHLLREKASGWPKALLAGRLWAGVGMAWVTLFIGSPYLFLAHEQYLSLARYQVSSLDFSLQETAPWWWIPRGLVQQEWVVGLLMAAGLIRALWRRQGLDWMLLAAWIPSFLYLGSWTRQSVHYLLHLYPLLALAAARLLEELAGRVPWMARRAWAVYGLALLVALPSAYQVVLLDVELGRPDTRQQAASWIEAHLPDGARLATTWLPYGPRLALKEARQSLAAHYRDRPQALAQLERAWSGRPAYHLVNLEVWLKAPVVPQAYEEGVDLNDPETRRVFSRAWRSPGQLQQMGVQYIVLPEATYGRYLYMDAPREEGSAAHYHFVKNRAYFSLLTDPESGQTERLASFPSGPRARGGGIHVYRLKPFEP